MKDPDNSQPSNGVQEEKQEKLPIDAKLLSEAIIELNISRRSVGLYPPNHPIVKESIEKAFGYLKKLFELRDIIALGVTETSLVIDEYTLDRKNPVFREFASVLHEKGIVTVTFSSGVTEEELMALHELLTMKDAPSGKVFIELADKKNLRHITIKPIELSDFAFTEGTLKEGITDDTIWETYVYCLLEGEVSDGSKIEVLNIPSSKVASLINDKMSDNAGAETYDRVITAYLKRKGDARLSRESFEKFISFVDSLRPELKRQFLSRTFSASSIDIGDVEKLVADMTSEDFEKIADFFSKHTSMIPETLKNLIDKLASVKKDGGFSFDLLNKHTAVVHDIEISEDLMKLFEEDHFKSYVAEDYQRDLEVMLKAPEVERQMLDAFRDEFRDEVIDRTTSEVFLELINADFISADDYLKLISRLTEFINIFVETGRFEEILKIHNTVYSHSLTGKRYSLEMIEYFFRSEQFISRLTEAFRIWGRNNRDGVIRLARVLKLHIIDPLLDALSAEASASTRKFLLSVIGELGTDVIPHAIRRLNDRRWYVVRNMLYLIKECGGRRYVEQVRKFAKHKHRRICMEAVKTLLHFKTHDAVPYLKLYLKSDDIDLRMDAVKLAGLYRITEAVPHITAMLEERDILGAKSYYRVDLIRSLGEIGDPKALKTLLKLYNSKSILYWRVLENLKVEIFKSLSNYPLQSIKPFVEQGLRSKSEEILSISKELSKKLREAESA